MFTLPSIALFIHIVGALGLFTLLGIEWVFLMSIRKASHISSVKQWFGIMANMGKVHGPSWLAVLIPGFYLSATIWGFQIWVHVTFLIIILMVFLGAFFSGKKLRAIGQSLTSEEILTDEIRAKLHNPVFILSASLRTALALEIILLMTIKPGVAGSLISLAAALLIGYIAQAGNSKSVSTVQKKLKME